MDDSIKSAIFIDDRIPSLFSNDKDEEEICKPLYESFQSKSCSLDFFRFDKESWKSKEKLIFHRKDLLILDWELNESPDLPYESTLEIINTAVSTDNLHFVCIYSLEGNEIDRIFYKILAYYSGNSEGKDKELIDNLKEILEFNNIDSGKFLEKISSIIKEKTLKIETKKIGEKLKKTFEDECGDKRLYGIFRKFLSENSNKMKYCDELDKLGFTLNSRNDGLIY
ncbi:response regulator receiver domain [Methanolapillus millepedarum]|uniref:Response receiver domain-containing protein n=1 Tax=Methanolapillus millepedarum TaxID=3028296 RepID=A0AA96ZUU8_9EURY|nr:hypothetical protein MsAc7_15860 [Methanosarcinaceae archaeon Ac7]